MSIISFLAIPSTLRDWVCCESPKLCTRVVDADYFPSGFKENIYSGPLFIQPSRCVHPSVRSLDARLLLIFRPGVVCSTSNDMCVLELPESSWTLQTVRLQRLKMNHRDFCPFGQYNFRISTLYFYFNPILFRFWLLSQYTWVDLWTHVFGPL